MLLECLPEHLVELIRRHLDPALADHLERGGNDSPDSLLRLRGNRDERREGREFEAPGEDAAPMGGLSIGGLDQVDLVHDDHQPLPRLERVASDMLILGQDTGRGIDDEQHRVRSLHRMNAAHEAVPLQAFPGR